MVKKVPMIEVKKILKKISDMAGQKYLIIGGLAVAQYVPTRMSEDIDLICEHDVSLEILEKVFPTAEWKIKDLADDSVHPNYEIRYKKDDAFPVIKFGPKIVEHGSYQFIDNDKLWKDASPFHYQNENYDNIFVPTVENLCYTKIISFLGRVASKKEKIIKDITDVINLSNVDSFQLGTFLLLFSDDLKDMIKKEFGNRIKMFNIDFSSSYIYQFTELFRCAVPESDDAEINLAIMEIEDEKIQLMNSLNRFKAVAYQSTVKDQAELLVGKIEVIIRLVEGIVNRR
jgi:hypothetical protein